MKNNVMRVSDVICTGCSACMNVCPVDAVKMQYNAEGFLIPLVDDDKCIDCGECTEKCPALNTQYKNKETPKIFAVMAEDDIRMKSSSGGVFTLLAEEILDQGGLVCGAAFDDDFRLSHVVIDSKDKLEPLKNSKYAQCSVDYTYRKIKTALDSGRKVLFTGTPCQVAGIKSYIGDGYDGLYTVDILCHGVPSELVFRKYIEEVSVKHTGKVSPLKDIKFRNKDFGWNCKSIHLEFEGCDKPYDKSEEGGDMFEFVYHKNLMLRKSCSKCKFAVYPRQGDLSMGDYWGITKLDKTMNDRKGTSIVFVNNDKGMQLLSWICDSFKRFKEMNVSPKSIKNRIKSDIPVNRQRERFLKMLRTKTLEEAIDFVKTEHFDIGLVGNFYASNFGGTMTQLALYHVLEDMGYSVLMIERPKNAPGAASMQGNLDKLYIEYPYPRYAVSPMYENKLMMRELNEKCDTFVVGSDQLFQYTLYRILGEFTALDWVNDTKKKIAYAASFGHDKIWGEPDIHSEMAYFMQKFDAFSVREEDGVDIARDNYGVNAEHVLDPVFLCDTKHYCELAEKSERVLPERYIGGYILDPSEEKQRIIKYAVEKTGLPVEIFSEYLASKDYIAPLGDIDVPELKTEERLQNIMNSELFITDSFHGTCFAVIMKKPFICILNNRRGASRFTSLLSMLHLENRLVTSEKELDRPELFEPIDYDAVYDILDKEKERCIKWLADALKKPKVKAFSDYDMMLRLKADSERDELMKIIQEQNEKIDSLENLILSFMGMDMNSLTSIIDIIDYLDELKKEKSGKIIVISVKETTGLNLSANIAVRLKDGFGLANYLEDKQDRPYIAVIDDGTAKYEQLGDNDDEVSYSGNVSGHELAVMSRAGDEDSSSVIKIDGTDHSMNKRGLNIVVFDKLTDSVIDSVAFDTNQSSAFCLRNNEMTLEENDYEV